MKDEQDAKQHNRIRIPVIFRASNPERENDSPRKSDAWCRALGWQDQIKEELRERES